MTLALLLVLHQKKKQQNQMECELSKQATTHFQQHAVDDDGDVDDALVGQVEDGQATKELVWVAAFPWIKKLQTYYSRYYFVCTCE